MNSQNTRRNSFSSFVKNLILLVSPSQHQANDEDELSLERTTTSESSPFQDMYFSFPAFEETYEDSNCAHSTFISPSSIVC
ncbi:hypothetical protein INT47_006342 [Mucor saturninus]|uniref:Uncharacterized protein n=1 Tax=Mucor saturninus TaxID=64648 RepID=A0A8H7VA65_9FUNG|nr:hypothetical protein INT47_006342 [Mucor saturninus]